MRPASLWLPVPCRKRVFLLSVACSSATAPGIVALHSPLLRRTTPPRERPLSAIVGLPNPRRKPIEHGQPSLTCHCVPPATA